MEGDLLKSRFVLSAEVVLSRVAVIVDVLDGAYRPVNVSPLASAFSVLCSAPLKVPLKPVLTAMSDDSRAFEAFRQQLLAW
jgi:hypothetical protein